MIAEWHRILRPGGKLMFSTVGPDNSIIRKGRQIAPNLYEVDYASPTTETLKMRCYLMQDDAHVRSLCSPFVIDEVGWFTNHYCGVDGFHWQVLAGRA